MEMETSGNIERIRNDRKAVSLGYGEWYNSFKEISKDFNKGDYVKIVFNEKKVDDKVFKNLKSMVKIKKDITITQDKPKENQTNDSEIGIYQIPNQSVNTVLMNVKDIITKEIECGTKYSPEEISVKIIKLTKDFKKAYIVLTE